MVHNSVTTRYAKESTRTSKMVINTIDITQKMESQKCKSRANSTAMATRKRQGLFELVNIDNDQFLNAMEHQTSYEPEKKERSTLVNSIENLMKYFEGEMQVITDDSGRSSPAKETPMKSKVASTVAALRSKCSKKTRVPSSQQKEARTECKSNIQELKKRYESTTEIETTPSPKAVDKFETSKLTRRSKVKQMALLFNQKINQMVKNPRPEPETPENVSPRLESSSSASPKFSATHKSKSAKLNSKMPTFVTKLATPKPSPHFKRKSQSLKKTSSVSSLVSNSSPVMRRKQIQKHPSTTCLVAENVFSQLSVKDKVLLYNKFIEHMSEKNPKIKKVLETTINKAVQRGEVVIERQNSVKNIRDSIEAKFGTKKTFSKLLPSLGKTSSSPLAVAPMHKDYDNILQSNTCSPLSLIDQPQDSLHVSSLTVVLKSTPKQKKSKSQDKKQMDLTFDENVVEPALKRTQNMIRSSLPMEPLAPPKKIRRTRNENTIPTFFFRDQDLEKLFFHWLKEKNGISFDITAVDDKETCIKIVSKNTSDNILPPKEIEKLLEKAIKKLERERKHHSLKAAIKEDAIVLMKNALDDEINMDKSTIEVELPLEVDYLNCEIQATNLDSSSINKTTSEEHQAELQNLNSFNPSAKQSRKKKLRRALTLNNNDTDSSDMEYKAGELKQQPSCTLPKSKKCSDYMKKNILKPLRNRSATAELHFSRKQSICDSLLRPSNSPSKIRNAYTLTFLSSPSTRSASDDYESDLPRTPNQKFSKSWPSLHAPDVLANTKHVHVEQTAEEVIDTPPKGNRISDSFVDQGFETGTTEMDSPLRVTNLKNLKNFSTPCKNQTELNTEMGSAKQSSIHRAASLNMAAIKEDAITKENSKEFQCALSSLNKSSTSSAAKQPSVNETDSSLSNTFDVASSHFWIRSGNFTAALSIAHYESETLMLLSNIFAQKTIKARDIGFGIDDQKFSFDNSSPVVNDFIESLPEEDKYSQYWFDTGNAIIPFIGNKLTTQKIQSFFNYIRDFAEDMTSLSFGIDAYEFSNCDVCLEQPTNKSIKTSDLDQSECETEENVPSHNEKSFVKDDESPNLKTSHSTDKSESLEKLLEHARLLNLSKTPAGKFSSETQPTLPSILKTLQTQSKVAPKSIDISNYREYMRELRRIIAAIDNIGCDKGFNNCTITQLESFVFFLDHYADLSLSYCNGLIQKILNVVTTQF